MAIPSTPPSAVSGASALDESALEACPAQVRWDANGIERTDTSARPNGPRAPSGLTTTKTANRGIAKARWVRGRMLLALCAVTLLAALATLFIGNTLLPRQGAP